MFKENDWVKLKKDLIVGNTYGTIEYTKQFKKYNKKEFRITKVWEQLNMYGNSINNYNILYSDNIKKLNHFFMVSEQMIEKI